MSQVKKVFPQDFEFVKPLLEMFAGSGFNVEKWKKLFHQYWISSEEHIGYMLVENECAVGFIGTIYSDRFIHRNHYKICNLSSWFVLPDYRSESLLLFREVQKNKEITITSFTSIPAAINILKRIGFKELDTGYFWYPPYRSKACNPISTCITDKVCIETILSDDEKKIFHDHNSFQASHYVFRDDKSYCYIITRNRNTLLRNLISNRYINYADFILRKLAGYSFLDKKRSVAHISYMSNPDFLFRNIESVNKRISDDLKLSGLLIDARFATNQKKMNRHKSCPRISLYRPASLNPSEIDSLYSELFILDLQ